MTITIPELALVVLVGVSGSGKSTFARKHFKATEVISSDACRGMVSDDETDQSATKDAFELLNYIGAKRLAVGRLTVIDATNVQPESRKPLVALARQHHCLPVAIVLDLPESECGERNRSRPDRSFGPHVLRQQHIQLRRSVRGLRKEGFRHVYHLTSQEAIDEAVIERQPLWNNRRFDSGPFDIVGDVHGCYEELCELMTHLGYEIREDQTAPYGCAVTPPDERKLVFVGDLVDRGPHVASVLRIAMSMVAAGTAYCVPGNHDIKLMRKLQGKNVQIKHGLAESIEQLAVESSEFRDDVVRFVDGLVSHYVFDDGRLVVAHAGLKESMQGRGSGAVRDFALYGDTDGETDEFGLPIRYPWAQDYRGKAMVVYGHTPIPEPEWINRTINIDTGCVFGGRLTALRYPEREIVSVPARRQYAAPVRPLETTEQAPNRNANSLYIADIIGKRIVSTKLRSNITIREENATAALETMSRFAIDPRWLIYLPPTMSPTATTNVEGFLEHPAEAIAYYAKCGVSRLVCEEKHMGSRAVVVLCRDGGAAAKRFGDDSGALGVCYTRTGRAFFGDRNLEQTLLARLRDVASRANLWDRLQSDWVCLDCELMPWSAKAQDLLKRQYAPVAVSSNVALSEARALLARTADRGVAVEDGIYEKIVERFDASAHYAAAYRRYCWPVNDLDGIRIAPFHVLASENAVHIDKDHTWHMAMANTLWDADRQSGGQQPIIAPTPFLEVDLTDEASIQSAIAWWHELTDRGGEGMVVKPSTFVARDKHGIIQPAVKCRGREYLRIIYGPEYTLAKNLERLRARGLGAKRSLAIREFALGIEALERFVQREPLYRVHECVFGVLALESEPVDPRL